MSDLRYTGTQVNYYFICLRKLWLFSKNIQFESENEDVQLGKLIDETSYMRQKKQIEIGNIKIDFIDNKTVIHEVKKSNKIEEAHIWQLKYYILNLRKMGLTDIKGEIDYPKLKKIKKVLWEDKDEEFFEKLFFKIDKIIESPKPPLAVKKNICSKCAYYEFCFV